MRKLLIIIILIFVAGYASAQSLEPRAASLIDALNTKLGELASALEDVLDNLSNFIADDDNDLSSCSLSATRVGINIQGTADQEQEYSIWVNCSGDYEPCSVNDEVSEEVLASKISGFQQKIDGNLNGKKVVQLAVKDKEGIACQAPVYIHEIQLSGGGTTTDVALTPSNDNDGDKIHNSVDTQKLTASKCATDGPALPGNYSECAGQTSDTAGGTTFGQTTTLAALNITDSPNSEKGLRVSGLQNNAEFIMCSSRVSVIFDKDEVADLTCTSAEIAADSSNPGILEILANQNAETIAPVRAWLPSGLVLILDDKSGNQKIKSAASNSSQIEVEVLSSDNTTLYSYSLNSDTEMDIIKNDDGSTSLVVSKGSIVLKNGGSSTNIVSGSNVKVSSSGVADFDGDGLYGSADNCPHVANPDQLDSDNDGIGDACDDDRDGDGVKDDVDNCPLDINPDQADFDNDGQGDVCDADDDNDGFLDADDHCPLLSSGLHNGCPLGALTTIELHIVTLGGGIPSTKEPISGVEIRVFDRNNSDFNSLFTKNPKSSEYGTVFETDAGRIGSCVTASDGSCTAGLQATADLLIIARYDDSATGKIIYTGLPGGLEDFKDTNNDGEGDRITKEMQIIKVFDKDGIFQKYQGGNITVAQSARAIKMLKQGDTLWALVRLIIGSTHAEVIKNATIKVAQYNAINVPEWGIIGGVYDAYRLLPGLLIDLSPLR